MPRVETYRYLPDPSRLIDTSRDQSSLVNNPAPVPAIINPHGISFFVHPEGGSPNFTARVSPLIGGEGGISC